MADIELDDPSMSGDAVSKATKTQLDKYINERIRDYETAQLCGRDLGSEWQLDFANFNAASFKKASETDKLCNYFRDHNVYIAKGIASRMPSNMVAALTLPWSEMPADQLPRNDAKFPMNRNTVSYNKQSDGASSNTYMWTSLSKMYSDVDDKYSGHPNESFNSKFKTFETYCTRAGIPNEKRNEAFDMMLKGSALDYHRTLCNNNSSTPDLESLKKSIVDAFQGKEHKLATLVQWNEVTLKQTLYQRDDKDIEAALNSLIITLRKMQPTLHDDLQTETFLSNKLLTACRDHPATMIACSHHHESLTSLIANLQASVATWKAKQRQNLQSFQQGPWPESLNQHFFTDRTYHHGEYHTRGHKSNNRIPNQSRLSNGYSKFRPKTCFVCRKTGCWSTRHSEHERQEARQRLLGGARRRHISNQNITELDIDKRLDQYIMETEGNDHEDSDVEDFVNFLTASNNFHDHDNDDLHEYFHTECGKVTRIQAKNLTQQLSDTSIKHAITSIIEDVDLVELDGVFLIQDRYGPTSVFHGILVDSGAAGPSTAGYQQYKAFISIFGPTELHATEQKDIKFGIGSTTSRGSISINTPLCICTFNIVNANTPFLLSLDDLDSKGIFLNNLTNTLVTDGEKKGIPVVRKFGHAFLQWGPITAPFSYLTESELRTLHRRFGHPSARKLHDILDRAGHTSTNHRALLEKISKFCEKCQKYGPTPRRFRFTLRDMDICFNHSIYVDILYIDETPVLHVVDEATRFQAARFLPSMASSSVWEALRECWFDTYLGPPDIITHDAGTNFTSTEFCQYTKSLNISVKEVPVEAANSIGIVERYHLPLRRAYQIIKAELDQGNRNKAGILQMAVKAVNDTAGPNGIVPTLLVFGAFPRITNTDAPAANIVKRAQAILKASTEAANLRAQRQISEAIRTRNGPSVDIIPIGSDVLVYRIHRNEWDGPFKLLSTEDETCTVQLSSGPTKFRSTQVKLYTPDQSPNSQNTATEPTEHSPNSIDSTIGHAPRPKRSNRRLPERYRNDQFNANLTISTSVAPDFTSSRQKELDGLISRGVFEFVDIDKVPENHRLFNSRFVDDIKFRGTPKAFEKSRLVIQAYNDPEKRTILTQSPTVQRSSQRLLISVTVTKHMSIFSRDISQAYTQSKSGLVRNIFGKPPRELNIPNKVVLKLKLSLYGVPEAGTYWFKTYHDHHTRNLKLTQTASDPCLLYSSDAIVALQTDDTLFACLSDYKHKEENAIRDAGFTAKPVEELTVSNAIRFNGALLSLSNQGNIVMTQSEQSKKISLVNNPSQYISQRARGAYISSVCQPQAAFDLSKAAQITEPSAKDIQFLNKRLQWQISNQNLGLNFVKLDPQTLRLIVFTDSSFANNADQSSQIGFVILLADAHNRCNLIQWSSIKCRRITRSVLASELYAMANGFDAACVIKHTIDNIFNRPLPLIVCIDSFSLYECLVKIGTTREKRLMIDISAIRQAYERREIAEIIWIKGSTNPADCLTKSCANKALDSIIVSNTVILDKEAWVERMININQAEENVEKEKLES